MHHHNIKLKPGLSLSVCVLVATLKMKKGLPHILPGLVISGHVKNEKYARDEKRMKFGFTIERYSHVGGPVMPV